MATQFDEGGMHGRGLGYTPGSCKQHFKNAIVFGDKAGRYAWKFEVPELPLYSQMHTIQTAKEVKRELTPKMIFYVGTYLKPGR